MLAKKFPITLKLCNRSVVLERAAMLHDADAEFAVIESGHKTKSRRKSTTGTFVPSIEGCGNGTKKVSWYLNTRYCPPLIIHKRNELGS